MKKMLRVLFLIATITLGTFTFSSCIEDNVEQKIALVIIAGRHANANMYTEKMLENAESLIRDSIVNNVSSSGRSATANISVIVSDGNPQRVNTVVNGKDILTCTGANTSVLERNKDAMISEIIDFLCSDDIKADDPQVDLLKSLQEASKILRAYYAEYKHHILIMDTGISTSGALDMTAPNIDIIEDDISDIIKKIEYDIPDLEGINVTFLNLGNVAGNQQQLGTTRNENKLVDLWTEILIEAGATLEDKIKYYPSEGEPMLYSEEADNGYLLVSPVYFMGEDGKLIIPEEIFLKPKEEPEPIPDMPEQPNGGWDFPSEQLGFKKSSAEFLDKNIAISTLNLISDDVEIMINNTDYRMYIVGSIANTSTNINAKYSTIANDRAQAIADILINDYNIPSDRIVVIDGGTSPFSWRNTNEFDENGRWHDTLAQQNRKVTIFFENYKSFVEELYYFEYVDENGSKLPR